MGARMVVGRIARGLAVSLLAFCVLVPNAGVAFADSASPWIASDNDDYAPGELVTLTGGDWQPGEVVNVDINDDEGRSWRRNVDVTADDSGGILDRFNLPDWFVATYQVVATGSTSGVATTSFTDGNVHVRTSGPNVTFQWRIFTANSTCSGAATSSGSVSAGTSDVTLGGVNVGHSIRIEVPATATGLNFRDWTGTGTFSTTTANPLCMAGVSGNRTLTANYAAPSTTATSVGSITASASTYGGTTNLSATVSPAGAPGTVAFYLAGSGTAVPAAYNASTGSATISDHAHGLNASTTAYSVRAVFTSTNASHASSEATNTSALTVDKANQASLTVTSPTAGTYGDKVAPAATGGSGTGAVSFTASGTACAMGTGADAGKLLITSGTGTCSVTAHKAGDANHSAASSAAHTVTIRPAVLSVDALAASKTYGDPDPALGWTLSGFVGGENRTSAGVTGEASCSREAGESVAGGPYAITCAPGTLEAANYRFEAGSTANLTIARRLLEVTAHDRGKTYGELDPALTYEVTAGTLVDGDGFTGSLTRDSGETVAAGPYAIRRGTLSAGDDYDLAFVGARLTIEPAVLSVDALAASKTYGDPDPALGWTLSGFVGGENRTSAGVTGEASCSREAGESVAGGPYAITCAPGTLEAGNYRFETGSTAALTIRPAPLTVRAEDKAKVLGAPDPDFTVVYSGLRNGDTPASVGGALTFATPAAADTSVGAFPIVPGGIASENYDVTYVDGTLRVVYGASCSQSAGRAILQPINADGSSVFKQGSTVPAKFRVCDAAGTSVGTSGVVTDFRLIRTISGTTTTSVNEPVISTSSDTAFRWDSTAQQWIFNVSTRNLSSGRTYVYRITLADGTAIEFRYGVR